MQAFLPWRLPYAETHYKFKLPWSPLHKPWPEIFLDAPHFCLPGKTLALNLIIKDAHYYPVRIKEVQLDVRSVSGNFQQTFSLNYLARDAFHFIPLPLKPEQPGNYVINGRLSVENPNGKRMDIWNNNYSSFSNRPLEVEVPVDTSSPLPDGWYSGETHCHSYYSSDPVEFGLKPALYQEAADNLGMDFVLITDHSYDFYYQKEQYLDAVDPEENWKRYRGECEALNGGGRPLVIPGEEVSCGNHLGQNVHLLVMGFPGFLPGLGDGGRRWFNNRPDKSVDEILEMLGSTPSFAAHPRAPIGKVEQWIFRRGAWGHPDVAGGNPNLCGLQFWNGSRGLDYKLGRKFWVENLLKGKKLAPIGANDAHGDLNQNIGVRLPLISLYHNRNHVFGKVRTCVQARECSLEGLQEGIRSGRVTASDGPFASLEWTAGEKLQLQARSKTCHGRLSRVHLFAGNTGDTRETLLQSWEIPAESFEWQSQRSLEKKFDYYRTETWTSADKLALTAPVYT